MQMIKKHEQDLEEVTAHDSLLKEQIAVAKLEKKYVMNPA